MNLLELDNLQIKVGDRTLCRDLNLSLSAGQSLGVLGRNGAGKTTLLFNLMGLAPPGGGVIRLGGRPVMDLPGPERARLAGILFQESASSFPATVLETVLLGRHPHAGSSWFDSPADQLQAQRALAEVGLEELAHRQLDTLSGGERQRVAIASLLAQDPRLYLLDEPSNHLDLDAQIRLLALLRDRALEQAGALVMASHDINLTRRFCDRVLLLLGDGDFLCGTTDAVLSTENLSRAFACPIGMIEQAGNRFFYPL